MPANLTPACKVAEAAFRKARDPGERLERLRDMLLVIPRHKGTDHVPMLPIWRSLIRAQRPRIFCHSLNSSHFAGPTDCGDVMPYSRASLMAALR